MRQVIALSAMLVLVGCGAHARFSQTGRFTGGPRATPPALYLDRDPVRPFRKVGLLTAVVGYESDELEACAKAAVEEGQAVGCDLVRYDGGEHGTHRFICGVWTTERP